MKISKASWHYRFNRFVQREDFRYNIEAGRYTTCRYVRTTAHSVLKSVVLTIGAIAIAVVLLFMLFSMFNVPYQYMFGNSAGLEEKDIVAAVVCWFMVFAVSATSTVTEIKKYMNKRSSTLKPKQRSVFTQAIIDQHDKICTRVEVE